MTNDFVPPQIPISDVKMSTAAHSDAFHFYRRLAREPKRMEHWPSRGEDIVGIEGFPDEEPGSFGNTVFFLKAPATSAQIPAILVASKRAVSSALSR
ncbi:hypothetical protein [Bradyrhizobium sp. BR 1433]|uniref:hypothetical protein n=1 Tax=Bradyrhizobium sp. BR 1433 TaxID=3447967 RepID=UPI003EE66A38